MIKLKPLLRTRFKCDFCNHVYVKANRCQIHEDICYKNPERHCDTCHDTGMEVINNIRVINGVPVVEEVKDCGACLIAEEVGGKSYIAKRLKE